MNDLTKAGLALSWHLADLALDIPNSNSSRLLRRGASMIGVAWSAYWLYRLLIQLEEAKLVIIDRNLANGVYTR